MIKISAASPELLHHEAPALVFHTLDDYLAVVDDPDLEVTPDAVLVFRNLGPRGYPGMPEVGNLPLPRKLLEHGVRDMVRITDARMSDTAYGTVILHIAPEAAAGGNLALVRTGDLIRVDVEAGPWTCSSTTSWPGDATNGHLRARRRSAVGPASTSTTSSRPTTASTSTSS